LSFAGMVALEHPVVARYQLLRVEV
jgi:hypothetical protein